MYPEEFEEFRRLSNGNSKESKEELRRFLRRIADEKQPVTVILLENVIYMGFPE